MALHAGENRKAPYMSSSVLTSIFDPPLIHSVQAMKDRMKNLAESLGMPPGLGGGPGV